MALRRCVFRPRPRSRLMVNVRVARILAGREVAICLDRPFTEPWIMGIDDARKLHRDLGEALGSLPDLGQEEAR
jgi:hypothetical protein